MHPDKFKTGGRLIRLSNALIWFRNQELARHGLTSSQFEVVRYLLTHRGEEITAGVLMQRLELSQSTVAGILKRLFAKGLIERRADARDGRREFVLLTEKGLELESALQGIADSTETLLLEGMCPEEQAELNRLLQIALDNMNARRTAEATERHG